MCTCSARAVVLSNCSLTTCWAVVADAYHSPLVSCIIFRWARLGLHYWGWCNLHRIQVGGNGAVGCRLDHDRPAACTETILRCLVTDFGMTACRPSIRSCLVMQQQLLSLVRHYLTGQLRWVRLVQSHCIHSSWRYALAHPLLGAWLPFSSPKQRLVLCSHPSSNAVDITPQPCWSSARTMEHSACSCSHLIVGMSPMNAG